MGGQTPNPFYALSSLFWMEGHSERLRVLVLAINYMSKILLTTWKYYKPMFNILSGKSQLKHIFVTRETVMMLMNALNEFKLCFYKGLKSGATNRKEDSWYFNCYRHFKKFRTHCLLPCKLYLEWVSGF